MKIIFILLISALGSFISTSLLYSQSKPEENRLLINSHPEGASVFINGMYRGVTPYTYEQGNSDSTKVRVEMNGIIREQKTMLLMGKMEMFFIMDGEYGLLSINTTPESAQAVIDDTLKFTTPFVNEKIKPGFHRLKIINKKYDDIERTIHTRYSKYDFNFQLERRLSRLMPVGEEIRRIQIDGFRANMDSMGICTVLKGKRKIEVYTEGRSRAVTGKFNFEAGRAYRLQGRYNHFTPKYMLLSAALPGLGQIMDKSAVKGAAYLTGTALMAALYLREDSDYKDKRQNYDMDLKQYNNALTETDARQARLKLEETVNDVNDSQKRKKNILAAAAGIYLLNIIDAVIFHATGSSLEVSRVAEITMESSSLAIKLNIK